MSGVPTQEGRHAFFAAAVPAISEQGLGTAAVPAVVLVRVSASRAGAPIGRAKTALDALHDDRGRPPYYRDARAKPPLPDDAPSFVRGLAVEVRSSPEDSTRYRIGRELVVAGQLVGAFSVDVEAPNDVWAEPAEAARIHARRTFFAGEVRAAWRAAGCERRVEGAQALLIRHRPIRDEDNTWSTWCAALCGVQRGGLGHWANAAPMAGWKPSSVASLTEPSLRCAARYEIYGPPTNSLPRGSARARSSA